MVHGRWWWDASHARCPETAPESRRPGLAGSPGCHPAGSQMPLWGLPPAPALPRASRRAPAAGTPVLGPGVGQCFSRPARGSLARQAQEQRGQQLGAQGSELGGARGTPRAGTDVQFWHFCPPGSPGSCGVLLPSWASGLGRAWHLNTRRPWSHLHRAKSRQGLPRDPGQQWAGDRRLWASAWSRQTDRPRPGPHSVLGFTVLSGLGQRPSIPKPH